MARYPPRLASLPRTRMGAGGWGDPRLKGETDCRVRGCAQAIGKTARQGVFLSAEGAAGLPAGCPDGLSLDLPAGWGDGLSAGFLGG